MSNVPHELAEEFPEFVKKMHDLKTSDQHFVKMSDEYHLVNREIHRIEIGDEHVSSFDEDALRKKRMQLKDQVFSYLSD